MLENRINPTPAQRFWLLIKPDQREITNVYIYSIFNGLVYLSMPLGIQAIINLIQGGKISTSWVMLVIFVISGIALVGILQIVQLRVTEILQQKIFTRAAFEFAFRLPRIKLEALYKYYAPELTNRFMDTITLQRGLSKIFIDFSSAIIQVLFGLLVLSFYHSFFILFSIGLIGVIYLFFRVAIKKGLSTSLAESKHKFEVLHWLQELARTNIAFKLAGTTDLPLDGVNKRVDSYLIARENHFKVLVKQYSLLVLFKVLVATGLLVIGGVLVMNQEMNIGQFVAAEIIILLIMSSIEKLVLNMEVIYDVLSSLEKIGQVTDLEIEKSNGFVIVSDSVLTNGLSIQLEDVSFKYPDELAYQLKSISIHIEAGQNVLISGANNSGKTTLLNILSGLYDVSGGHLSYNGFPKGSLELTSLWDIVGECLTDEKLFHGTILENITMGRPAATMENVTWAVENLGLKEFIRKSAQGYDSLIDGGGKKISRSIVQRLLLARSIVIKPKLLLLNDCFKSIEIKERKKLMEFICRKSNQWTLVVVSQEDYFAQQADLIVLMKDGQIVDSGNYEKLKSIISNI